VPSANQTVPDLLERLHIERVNSGACHGDWIAGTAGGDLVSFSPATGEALARVRMAGPAEYETVMARAAEAFLEWRMMPAPKRGEIVRESGNDYVEGIAVLDGKLVTLLGIDKLTAEMDAFG